MSVSNGVKFRCLSRTAIVQHSGFLAVEQNIANELIDIHRENPRMARLMASYKKWLMTHVLFALSKEKGPDGIPSGLTPGRLLDVMMHHGTVSRNTASAYLAELVAYKFLEPLEAVPDRRLKLLKPTHNADEGMRRWFNGHLACLDSLDGGNRVEISLRRPELAFQAQPRMIRRILEDATWNAPSPSMAYFLDSDVGGMLVHYIVSRVEARGLDKDRIKLGPLSAIALADMFAISATNIKRMFRKCEEAGLLGWEKPRRRGDFWVSRTFLEDHFARQSVKFEMVDEAFSWAVEEQRRHASQQQQHMEVTRER